MSDDIEEQLAQFQTSIDGLSSQLTTNGGNNVFYYAKEFWNNGVLTNNVFGEANLDEYTDTEIQRLSVSGKGYKINSGDSIQENSVKNDTYTISFYYKKLNAAASCYFSINNEQYELTATTWTRFIQTVNIDTTTIRVSFNSDVNNGLEIFDLMGNIGTEPEIWTQNPNETRTDTVTIGKGIQVNSSEKNTYTRIDADGNRTFNADTHEVVAEMTDKGVVTAEIEANKSQIGGILTQEIDGQTWISSLL
jgi:hypothetical protein